ncbi:apolipoprotein D [Scaptodrosophila lebanonensis]|uniref:Apolipoprotein D n=1 Tax=Drosophila lebanonensis TaxID=7225 RepID=A0A6J2U812_DROLE|nr:apolipoprotein D [Scaptodrosophila lebanonensis]
MRLYLRASLCSVAWLLVFVAPTALAQVPFPGQCPEVKVMDTFDLEAYLGIWYENAKYPFAFDIGKKCIYANYTLIDGSTVGVVNAAINRFTGQPSSVTGTAKVIAPAQLAVTFSKNQVANRPNYLVLGTDYESYAVVYSCTNLPPLAHLKIVWILTRERKPSPDTVATAKEVLDNNQISRKFLIDTLQKGCPILDDNETETTTTLGDDDDDFTTTTLPNAIEKA